MIATRVVGPRLIGAVTACLMGAVLPSARALAGDEVKKVPYFRYVADGSQTIKQTKGKWA
jgi:hypothetical protein